MRAAFVSVNLFSLLCTGNEPVGTSALGDIMRYGGPITYLIFYIFFLFGVLVRFLRWRFLCCSDLLR
jgi:ATP-binding cassette subfamily A (ABC1) protein 3